MLLEHATKKLQGMVALPASKSESNRWLILQALAGDKISINNLSEARDTRLLAKALASDKLIIDVQDAGTAMRFLTAYFCATKQHRILKGTARMNSRPMYHLTDALMQLGFRINYMALPGFPPLECIPVNQQKILQKVAIAANVSSQYVSALLMIAPSLPGGMELQLTTSISSEPYIQLTLHCLRQAGIGIEETKYGWNIAPQPFSATEVTVESDWSAAGYLFAIAALSFETKINLPGLSQHSFQGDKIIADWLKFFGVHTTYSEKGLNIHKEIVNDPSELHLNFKNHPDLAMTMIVLCAAKDINLHCTGLESLRIKETDRIAALQNELKKVGKLLTEVNGVFELHGKFQLEEYTEFSTYNDHRMAMAFAPLAMLKPIKIENPIVVEKSFPGFFAQLETIGFVNSQ